MRSLKSWTRKSISVGVASYYTLSDGLDTKALMKKPHGCQHPSSDMQRSISPIFIMPIRTNLVLFLTHLKVLISFSFVCCLSLFPRKSGFHIHSIQRTPNSNFIRPHPHFSTSIDSSTSNVDISGPFTTSSTSDPSDSSNFSDFSDFATFPALFTPFSFPLSFPIIS